jgi:hypothetical protein
VHDNIIDKFWWRPCQILVKVKYEVSSQATNTISLRLYSYFILPLSNPMTNDLAVVVLLLFNTFTALSSSQAS